jgi:cell division transport system permease protein
MSHWLNHHLQAIKLVLSRMRKDALSSFIICLVIAVALCLPSLFYLGVDNLSKLSDHMQNETEISLFLKLDSNSATIAEIESALSKNSDILEYHFVCSLNQKIAGILAIRLNISPATPCRMHFSYRLNLLTLHNWKH